MSALLTKAISHINNHGILLVFPLNNKSEPKSVWSCLYPRTKMRWEWDDSADNKVVQMWRLREQLSRSGQVVYSKWYQGRATCFSKEVFTHLLAAARASQVKEKLPIRESKEILESLEMDSPLSTKKIKEAVGLQGKSLEGLYNKAMKDLWLPGLIVGFGEVEDSSFPSLAVGATSVLFEELWLESLDLEASESLEWIKSKIGQGNLFYKYLAGRVSKSLSGQSLK